MADFEARFWSKVDRSGGPDACWLWMAGRYPGGYGKFYAGGANRGAHCVSCELAHGPPSFDGAKALHSCDNKPCVNPAHLRWGTQAANVRDMVDRGRQSRGERHSARLRETAPRGDRNGARKHRDRLPRGDAHYSRASPDKMVRGERHGNAKLTADDVRAIRSAEGSHRSIASKFGVGQATVSRIRSGMAWVHVA